jgi:hypothetical protein
VPLVDAGLDLHGLDVSSEALRQLTARRPGLSARLHEGEFQEFEPPVPLAYVIAIQVFQHGTAADAAAYFARVAALLARGGLFFLRVNSAATQVVRRHTVIERDGHGGFSVRYQEGPKARLAVHFYARDELNALTGPGFDALLPPREEIILRPPPARGFWAQWEAVYRRRRTRLRSVAPARPAPEPAARGPAPTARRGGARGPAWSGRREAPRGRPVS